MKTKTGMSVPIKLKNFKEVNIGRRKIDVATLRIRQFFENENKGVKF